jgi:pimeloyl-ACP methyl ester carboxylesterase
VIYAGQGEPVLLLHGISSSADAFRHQMEGLADGYRLIAWDAPGYARSGDPPGRLTIDGYADAAGEVLDTLGVAEAHVVGASWGGVIATRLALQHPGLVRSLALIGSTPGRGADAAVAAELRQRSAKIAEEGVAAYARARARWVLSPGAPAALVAEVEGRIASSVRLPGYGYAAESLAATDHRDALPRIRASTLVLVGEHDGVTGLEESRVLARSIPGARLVTVAGAGHLANQEQPGAVNAELREHWHGSTGPESAYPWGVGTATRGGALNLEGTSREGARRQGG